MINKSLNLNHQKIEMQRTFPGRSGVKQLILYTLLSEFSRVFMFSVSTVIFWFPVAFWGCFSAHAVFYTDILWALGQQPTNQSGMFTAASVRPRTGGISVEDCLKFTLTNRQQLILNMDWIYSNYTSFLSFVSNKITVYRQRIWRKSWTVCIWPHIFLLLYFIVWDKQSLGRRSNVVNHW